MSMTTATMIITSMTAIPQPTQPDILIPAYIMHHRHLDRTIIIIIITRIIHIIMPLLHITAAVITAAAIIILRAADIVVDMVADIVVDIIGVK